MMTNPDGYIGKSVRMTGMFSVYENEETGKVYLACIITDATACCAQGIEFVLAGDYSYPEDYPEVGSEITIEGIYGVYTEDDGLYCQLSDAVME